MNKKKRIFRVRFFAFGFLQAVRPLQGAEEDSGGINFL